MVGIYLALLFNNELDFALLTGLDLVLSIGFRLSVDPQGLDLVSTWFIVSNLNLPTNNHIYDID